MKRAINTIARRIGRIRGGDDGFTLIELVVAAAISSVILLMVYSAHTAIMNTIRDLTKVAGHYEEVNLALSRVDGDISCAYINRSHKKTYFFGGNNRSAPHEGKIRFVTVNRRAFPMLSSPAREHHCSDVHEVSYYLKPDRSAPDLFYLVRRESISYDDEAENEGAESVLLRNVTDLKFEFMLKNSWTDSWDSKRDSKYPEMVKTSIKLKKAHAGDEEFVFTSLVSMEKP
jgi:type II secretion system protein J